MYKLIFTKKAQKDALELKEAGLKEKTQKLLDVLEENPYHNSPPDEKLVGDLRGFFSRRINIQYRLIYEVLEKEKKVKILRMGSHYEN